MKLDIRNGSREDLDILAEIDRRCFPAGVAYSREELLRYMSRARATTLVAVHAGRIAGFLLFEVVRPPSLAVLVTIDVPEASRRLGVGSRLLEHSERLLEQQGCRRYRLQVATSNRVALGFYERRGFRILGTIDHYYDNGDDAYVMEKSFQEGTASSGRKNRVR